MTTPTVINLDPSTSQVLSPIRDEPYGIRLSDSGRRSRRQAVEKKNFKDMRSKYHETKAQMERMKRESESNKKMLLEMSGVLSALKDISVEYERDELASKSPAINVERKIRAIDSQLKNAVMQCGHLEQEKELQSSTIKAQEGQIKTMEDQIAALQDQLQKAEADQQHNIAEERLALARMNQEGELAITIKAQETKIQALEEKLLKQNAEKNKVLSQQILALKGSNEAKYAEIHAMEKKLEALRNAQTTQIVPHKGQDKNDKHVSFGTNALVKFTRGNKNGNDHTSYCSTSTSSTFERMSLASISEEDSCASEVGHDIFADDVENQSTRSSSSRSESTNDSSTKSSVTDHSSIQITHSADEEVEISVGKPGNIDVSDFSYTTEASTKSSGTNFEEEYNRAMLKLQEIQAENQKLRKNHSEALSNMAQVSDVTANAEKFREEHSDLKKVAEEQKHLATMANARCEKLRRENLKLTEDLNEEKQKYEQLMNDYGKVAHRKEDMDEFVKLKETHSAVVMKMAELSDEHEQSSKERDQAVNDLEVADSKNRSLTVELEATKNAYEDLQKEHDVSSNKLRKLTQQCDELKTKYYESLATDSTIQAQNGPTDEKYELLRREYGNILEKLRSLEAKTPSVEKLSREHAEAKAKLGSLQGTEKELEELREKFNEKDSMVTTLKKDLSTTTKKLASAEKREQQSASHLKDMLSHYKRLEKEHDEVQQKLKSAEASADTKSSPSDPLQLTPAGYGALADQTRAAALHAKVSAFEKRTKELQQQRDNAIDQLNQVEEELIRTRLEKREAIECRKAREEDLRVVVGRYRELQRNLDDTKSTVSKLESELIESPLNPTTASTDAASVVVGAENTEHSAEPATLLATDEPGTSETETNGEDAATKAEEEENNEEANDGDSIAQLLVDMETLKKQKEDRIAQGKEAPLDGITVSNPMDGLHDEPSAGDSVASDLSDEAPSTGWKDVRIAKLMKELEQAKSYVWELEAKEEALKAQMEISERKLEVALREADEAKRRQASREGNLRDAVAQSKKLEKEYKDVQANLKDLQSQLEKAKKEAKIRDEETKEARKRANNYHAQFKKVQEKLQRIEMEHPFVRDAE